MRCAQVLALALALIISWPRAASAADRSPYLFHARGALEQVRTRDGDALGKRATRALDKALRLLDEEDGGFRSQVATFKRVAKLSSRLRSRSPDGVLGDAAAGFEAEIRFVAEEARERLDALASKGSGSAARRARKLLAAVMKLSGGKARRLPIPRRAKRIQVALSRLTAAVAAMGKITKDVTTTWIECDSVGPVGTPYVTGVNCRTVLVDGFSAADMFWDFFRAEVP